MASSSSAEPVTPDTEIAIKLQAQGVSHKLKLPFKSLSPAVLPHKLRAFLGVHPGQVVVFERYSDSTGSYVNLDHTNTQAYKTLARAAKAKRRLRLRAHVGPSPNPPQVQHPLAKPVLVDVSAPKTEGVAASLPPMLPMPDLLRVSATSAQLAQLSEADITAMSTIADIDVKRMTERMRPTQAVATAIAGFCEGQATAMASATAKGQTVKASSSSSSSSSSVEEKNIDFLKRVREMDGQIKEKIAAHRARQSACRGCTSAVKPEEIKQEEKSLGPIFSIASPPKLPNGATFSWSVYCNHCNKNMLDEHFHCNSCENGDYDLCTDCVAQGKHCLEGDHWLIKRFLRNGKVINGETQKIVQSPKPKSSFVDMPGAFVVSAEKKPEPVKKPTRTCNCCVNVAEEDAFVNCKDCKDYDLCQKCLFNGEHGHHPGHTFVPATKETLLTTHAQALCKPGRNAVHGALCDECDDRIVGVRYKCLVCPDWDYCTKCYQKSSLIHRGHRFAPVYESIVPQTYTWAPTHSGVYCDGPLCKGKNSYITGIRFKCAVCDDLDYCASCEALPNLKHNMTHPLIKFRTPVRSCSVSTLVDAEPPRPAAQDCTTKTQICTVAEVKPTECCAQTMEKAEIKDTTTQTGDEQVLAKELPDETNLDAYFVCDTVSDGTVFKTNQQFFQDWTLQNTGSVAWPAGCSVHYVGGDNMLNIANGQPSADVAYAKATESNVMRDAVQPGAQVSFGVLLKAPEREGTAISYWRLKTPCGTPFGHRLWCHISVEGRAQPEIGRLGAHDAFLRHNLNEQINKECKDKCLSEQRPAYLQEIIERLERLRTAAEAQTSPSESVAEPSKPQKVKIEVIEADSVAKQSLSFPTLDVSSSVSSAATEAVVTNAAAVENVPAIAPAVATPSPTEHQPSIFDDAESITVAESIDLSSESEDGFMTEDEYDILDASDNEIA